MLKQTEVNNKSRSLAEDDGLIESDGTSFTKKQIIYGYWNCKHVVDEMNTKGLTDSKYTDQLSSATQLKPEVWESNPFTGTITQEEIELYFQETSYNIDSKDLKDVEDIVNGSDSVEVKYKAVFDKNGGIALTKNVGLLKSKKKRTKK